MDVRGQIVRNLSTWLSLSSMALIWWMVRHATHLDKGASMIWVQGLPAIMALAAFAVSPYTVANSIKTISSFREKFKQNEDQPQS